MLQSQLSLPAQRLALRCRGPWWQVLLGAVCVRNTRLAPAQDGSWVVPCFPQQWEFGEPRLLEDRSLTVQGRASFREHVSERGTAFCPCKR